MTTPKLMGAFGLLVSAALTRDLPPLEKALRAIPATLNSLR